MLVKRNVVHFQEAEVANQPRLSNRSFCLLFSELFLELNGCSMPLDAVHRIHTVLGDESAPIGRERYGGLSLLVQNDVALCRTRSTAGLNRKLALVRSRRMPSVPRRKNCARSDARNRAAVETHDSSGKRTPTRLSSLLFNRRQPPANGDMSTSRKIHSRAQHEHTAFSFLLRSG